MNSHNNCNLYTIFDIHPLPSHILEYIMYIVLHLYMTYIFMDSLYIFLHSSMCLINTLPYIHALSYHYILHIHPNIVHNNHLQPLHILYDKKHMFHLHYIFYIQFHKIYMFDLSHNIQVNKLYKYLSELDIKYIDLICIEHSYLQPVKIQYHKFCKH